MIKHVIKKLAAPLWAASFFAWLDNLPSEYRNLILSNSGATVKQLKRLAHKAGLSPLTDQQWSVIGDKLASWRSARTPSYFTLTKWAWWEPGMFGDKSACFLQGNRTHPLHLIASHPDAHFVLWWDENDLPLGRSICFYDGDRLAILNTYCAIANTYSESLDIVRLNNERAAQILSQYWHVPMPKCINMPSEDDWPLDFYINSGAWWDNTAPDKNDIYAYLAQGYELDMADVPHLCHKCGNHLPCADHPKGYPRILFNMFGPSGIEQYQISIANAEQPHAESFYDPLLNINLNFSDLAEVEYESDYGQFTVRDPRIPALLLSSELQYHLVEYDIVAQRWQRVVNTQHENLSHVEVIASSMTFAQSCYVATEHQLKYSFDRYTWANTDWALVRWSGKTYFLTKENLFVNIHNDIFVYYNLNEDEDDLRYVQIVYDESSYTIYPVVVKNNSVFPAIRVKFSDTYSNLHEHIVNPSVDNGEHLAEVLAKKFKNIGKIDVYCYTYFKEISLDVWLRAYARANEIVGAQKIDRPLVAQLNYLARNKHSLFFADDEEELYPRQSEICIVVGRDGQEYSIDRSYTTIMLALLMRLASAQGYHITSTSQIHFRKATDCVASNQYILECYINDNQTKLLHFDPAVQQWYEVDQD